eukprot:183475_1
MTMIHSLIDSFIRPLSKIENRPFLSFYKPTNCIVSPLDSHSPNFLTRKNAVIIIRQTPECMNCCTYRDIITIISHTTMTMDTSMILKMIAESFAVSPAARRWS